MEGHAPAQHAAEEGPRQRPHDCGGRQTGVHPQGLHSCLPRGTAQRTTQHSQIQSQTISSSSQSSQPRPTSRNRCRKTSLHHSCSLVCVCVGGWVRRILWSLTICETKEQLKWRWGKCRGAFKMICNVFPSLHYVKMFEFSRLVNYDPSVLIRQSHWLIVNY